MYKPIPPIKVHDILNQKIWDDETLRPKIKAKMLEIAVAFNEFLNTDTPYLDVLFTGSLANYNYSPQSDIDLHVLYDFNKINFNTELTRELLQAKKTVWNEVHEIKIKGFDVELYPQSIREPHKSSGIYSVLNNKWLVKPNPSKPKVNMTEVHNKARYLAGIIDKVLKSKNLDKIQKLQDKIKAMRQSGLSKGGEFSIENLAFKALRYSSNLKKLIETKIDILDERLSLNKKDLITSNRYDFSSTEFNCPTAIKKRVITWGNQNIPNNKICEKEGGREQNSYITIKYGLQTNNVEDVMAVVKNYPPFKVTLGKMRYFFNNGYNVLKIEVKSDPLIKLNKLIASKLKNTESHPVYNPHLTIAYVADNYKKWENNTEFEGVAFRVFDIYFSSKDGTRIKIPLRKIPSVSMGRIYLA